MIRLNHTLSIAMLFVAPWAFAASSMTLIPDTTSVALSTSGTATVNYTLTNNASINLTEITIDPAFGGGDPAGLAVASNTCSGATLVPAASCAFSVVMAGVNQATNFTLSPRACAFNGMTCAQATSAYRVSVTLSSATTPTGQAYVGITSGVNANNVQVVDMLTPSLGDLISGFFFETIFSFSDHLFKPSVQNIVLSTPVSEYISDNGQTLYVTNAAGLSLSVVDLTLSSPAIVDNITTTDTPTSVVALPDESKIYVCNSSLSADVIINGAVDHQMFPNGFFTSPSTCYLAITPDGSKVYMLSGANNKYYVFQTSDDTYLTQVSLGMTPIAAVVSPDGSKLYISLGANVAVYNTANNTLITTITPTFALSPSFANATQGLAISPAGDVLYVAKGPFVDIIETVGHTQTGSIMLPAFVLGLSLSLDGSQLIATSEEDNNVFVINTADNTFTALDVQGHTSTIGRFAR